MAPSSCMSDAAENGGVSAGMTFHDSHLAHLCLSPTQALLIQQIISSKLLLKSPVPATKACESAAVAARDLKHAPLCKVHVLVGPGNSQSYASGSDRLVSFLFSLLPPLSRGGFRGRQRAGTHGQALRTRGVNRLRRRRSPHLETLRRLRLITCPSGCWSERNGVDVDNQFGEAKHVYEDQIGG